MPCLCAQAPSDDAPNSAAARVSLCFKLQAHPDSVLHPCRLFAAPPQPRTVGDVYARLTESIHAPPPPAASSSPPPSASPAPSTPRTGLSPGASDALEDAAEGPDAADTIAITFKDLSCQLRSIRAHVTTPMVDIFRAYTDVAGVPPGADNQSMIYAGRQLSWEDDSTPESLGMVDGAVIHVVLRLRGD